MPSEGAKGVPRVTTRSSCRSCTGLSSWVTDLNFSGKLWCVPCGGKGLVGAGDSKMLYQRPVLKLH